MRSTQVSVEVAEAPEGGAGVDVVLSLPAVVMLYAALISASSSEVG